MSVRAKFCVKEISVSPGEDTVKNEDGSVSKKIVPFSRITLEPVFGTNDPKSENSKFYRYTPSGSIVLGTINPEAAAAFEIGRDHYVDFTKAE